jgi:hypothetical protein
MTETRTQRCPLDDDRTSAAGNSVAMAGVAQTTMLAGSAPRIAQLRRRRLQFSVSSRVRRTACFVVAWHVGSMVSSFTQGDWSDTLQTRS